MLLGRFIKKLTHHEPEYEIKSRVIDKLHLQNTYFVINKEAELSNINQNKMVHGYAFFTKKSKPYPFLKYGADTLSYSLSYTNTAGAMISTPQDINTYLHAIFEKQGMFNQYKKQLTTFVSRQTGKPISQPSSSDKAAFGLGIIGFYWNKEHPIIYLYNGTTDGFNFAWIMDPASQTYLVFAINSSADLVTLESGLELFSKIEESCKS